MAITLGKDCAIAVGANIVSARNVTVSESVTTIEVEEFGSRINAVYSTGYDASVSVELNDSADATSLITTLQAGTSVTVSGGTGGWSFPAVVTGVSETFSVDGVATFTIEAKITRTGLR